MSSQYGPLAAKIISLVWGNPANFNGFRVLAALLHGTLAVGFAAFNRGHHLYSAGRPSRWALAHILVSHGCLWEQHTSLTLNIYISMGNIKWASAAVVT